MKKLLALLLAALLPALCFAGCKKDDSITTIRLNEVTHSIFYAPQYLAMSLGYFEEENIKIELTNGGGADAVMTALLSGSADIGLMGPEAAIYVYNEGKKDHPVIFGQMTKRDGSFLISRVPEPDFKWSDLAGKEVLAGRRGGVPAMTLQYVLNQNGLFDGVNVTMNYDVAFNLMAGAFEGGQGDYTTLFEPTASDFVAAGKGYIVASVGADSGEVPYTAYAAAKSFLEKNPDVIKAFLRAVYRAVDFMFNEPSDVVAEKLLPHFTGTEKASIVATLENYKKIDAWMTKMSMTKDSFDRLQTIMENAGELDKRANFDALINNSFSDEVYKEVFGK